VLFVYVLLLPVYVYVTPLTVISPPVALGSL